jgi:palmitoyl-protein thioesterase
LHTLCAVKASKDTVVIPKESEWFGFYADNSLEEVRPLSTLMRIRWSEWPLGQIIPMNQTAWYLEDWYGLKSLDKGGALQFFSTSGNHLDFETDELLALIDDCFTV